MKLTPFTYDGTALNDSSFAAEFVERSESRQAESRPVLVPRAHTHPLLGYSDLQARNLLMRVRMNGNRWTQTDTLNGLFLTKGNDKKTLIAKDGNNSDKQWQMSVKPTLPPAILGGQRREMVVTLLADNPYWESVTENSNVWNISATGATNSITPGGNVEALPTYQIKPTGARGAPRGFAYQKFYAIDNPISLPLVNYPLDITDGGLNTAALIADNANKAQINDAAGITAGANTIPYDTVTGTLPSVGTAMIENEQIRWTGKTGTASGNLTGVTRGINGTTAATHADNVEIKVSKMQADGGDIRVYVDGVEVDHWLAASGSYVINGATTQIWTNLNLAPKINLTLGTAIAASGAITTITFADTAANRAALALLPDYKMLIIGDEVFTYTTRNLEQLKVTGVTRAAKGSAEAAHAAGDSVRFVEHEIWLMFGDIDATARVTDDTRKPILNLVTSTNTSWVYAEFADEARLRSGIWYGTAVVTLNYDTRIYGGNQGVDANPFAEMGMRVKSTTNGANLIPSVYGMLTWTLYQPVGVTNISHSGEGYRTTAVWPPVVFEVSDKTTDRSRLWTPIRTFTSPGSASSWTAWGTHSDALGATYRQLRYRMEGPSGAGGEAAFEAGDVTLTLASARAPVITPQTEMTNTYHVLGRLTNNQTGDYIDIDYVMVVNQTLEIDTYDKVVTYTGDGSRQPNAIKFSSKRDEWLPLEAGVANQLQFDDTNTGNVTITTLYRDRNT
jgi:hypothetical protein